MALKAGKLRHYVEIQQPVIVVNTSGEREQTWQHVAFMWAAIEPLSAREFVASQQVQSNVSARITIRSYPRLRQNMRVVHGLDFYNIEGILTDKDSGVEYMTLPCSTGLNDG